MQLGRGTVHRAPTFYIWAMLRAQASNHIQRHVIARSPPGSALGGTKQSQEVSVQNAITELKLSVRLRKTPVGRVK